MREPVRSNLWLAVAATMLALIVSAKLITFNEEEDLIEDVPIGSFEVQAFFEQQNVR